MYQPAYYKEEDRSKAFDFIERHPFGILVSRDSFLASHLPIMVNGDQNKLYTHVAERNLLAHLDAGTEILAIFHGPQAYISPKHYKSSQSVPTWNYIAVHVKGRIINLDRNRSEEILMQLVEHIEPEYKKQWQGFSVQYKSALINEMRPLGMEIDSVQMTMKISQNKSKSERQRIADYLLSTEDSNAREIAVAMQKTL